MRRCFLDLGSNRDRRRSLLRALELLGAGFELVQVSSVYETDPVGCQAQPLFYNLAVEFRSGLAPVELRADLRRIEVLMGRVRSANKYEPRRIDIDLLLCGDLVQRGSGWELPHPDVANQPFVIHPLCELAPDLVHPHTGQTLLAMAGTVPTAGIRRLGPTEAVLRA